MRRTWLPYVLMLAVIIVLGLPFLLDKSGITGAPIVSNGVLSCEFINSNVCPMGYGRVLGMSNQTNAQAELPNESNYLVSVCCRDTLGVNVIGAAATGTAFLKLHNSTNSQVELFNETNYNLLAYIKASAGTINCTSNNTAGNCGTRACVGTISDVTNAHIGNCSAGYTTTICCSIDPVFVARQGGGMGGTLQYNRGQGTPRLLVMTKSPFVTPLLYRYDQVHFTIDGIVHTLTIFQITGLGVVVDVASTPMRYTIGIGETRSFDVTGDGISDISATVTRLQHNSVELTMQKSFIEHPAPAQAPVQEPAVVQYAQPVIETAPIETVTNNVQESESSLAGHAGDMQTYADESAVWTSWTLVSAVLFAAVILAITVIMMLSRKKQEVQSIESPPEFTGSFTELVKQPQLPVFVEQPQLLPPQQPIEKAPVMKRVVVRKPRKPKVKTFDLSKLQRDINETKRRSEKINSWMAGKNKR